MHETQILDAIDSLTLNSLDYNDKAVLVAFIKSEIGNKRLANNINKKILEKVNELYKGNLKEASNESDSFQDFSETSSYSKPFEIINKDDIDKFLDKMTSKNWDGDFFGDTFEFYHPIDNMKADGVPRHRSDFNK